MTMMATIIPADQGDSRKLIVHMLAMDIFWDDQGTSVSNPLQGSRYKI